MVRPADRKLVASHLIVEHQISERRACQLAGISRTKFRYQAARFRNDALRLQLIALAVQRRCMHGMLRAEGLVTYHKRTDWIYAEEGLQLYKRRKQKLSRPA